MSLLIAGETTAHVPDTSAGVRAFVRPNRLRPKRTRFSVSVMEIGSFLKRLTLSLAANRIEAFTSVYLFSLTRIPPMPAEPARLSTP